MDKMLSLKKERLIYAREYYGFSLDEVSEKTNIKKELLSKCENGEDFLSYAQLSKLSDFYNQSLLFFFLNGTPLEDKFAISFRKIQKESGYNLSKKVKEMMDKANIYRLNLCELYENQETESFSDSLTKNSINDDKKLIDWLREKLDLSLEKQKNFTRTSVLLDYLREVFYEIGIYIFKDSFQDMSVSGLCLFDEKYPIILINNKTTFNRQIFTIFHEVYHLYCRETDIDFSEKAEEKACDKFAAEFLIPDEDFSNHLAEIESFEIRDFISHLANLYTVSEDAIMYRLLAKGIISSDFYQKVRTGNFRNINSATSGGNFYFTRMSYLGKPYLNRVFNLYYSGHLSISRVGMYTQLKPVHVAKLASNAFGGGC